MNFVLCSNVIAFFARQVNVLHLKQLHPLRTCMAIGCMQVKLTRSVVVDVVARATHNQTFPTSHDNNSNKSHQNKLDKKKNIFS